MNKHCPHKFAKEINNHLIEKHKTLNIIIACLNEIGINHNHRKEPAIAEIIIDGKDKLYLNHENGILILFNDTSILTGPHTLAEIPLADPQCFEKIKNLVT